MVCFNKKIMSAISALALSFGLFATSASASEAKEAPVYPTATPVTAFYTDINEYNAVNFDNNEIIISQTVTEEDGEIIIDTLFEIPDEGVSMYASGTHTTGFIGNKKSFGFKTVHGWEETAYAIVYGKFEYNPDTDYVKAIDGKATAYVPPYQDMELEPVKLSHTDGFLFVKAKATATLKFTYTNNLNKTTNHTISVSCKSNGDVDGVPENQL